MTQNPPIRNKAAMARVKALTRAYVVSAREMERTLRDAVLSDAARWRMEQHLAQVQAIVDALNGAVLANVQGIVGPVYEEGADIARRALREAGVRLPGRAMETGINTSAVQAITDQMAQDLLAANGTLDASARRILTRTQQAKTEEAAINRLVMDGVLQGQTRGKLSRGLYEQIVQDLGGAAKVTAGGRRFDPGYYATLVSGTRYREAATAGIINTSVDVGVTLFKVSIHEGACVDCQAWQGKVYSLGGGDKRFPELARRPPFHPNCEHVLLPFVEDRYTEKELLAVARVSNDPGYITSTRDWEEARRGAKLPIQPRDFMAEREARRKGRRVTVSKPTAPAKAPAKPKVQPAAGAGKAPAVRTTFKDRADWEAYRAEVRKAARPKTMDAAKSTVLEVLKKGRLDARYDPRVKLPARAQALVDASMNDNNLDWMDHAGDDVSFTLAETMADMARECDRLGIPQIRACFRDKATSAAAWMGNGSLGLYIPALKRDVLKDALPDDWREKIIATYGRDITAFRPITADAFFFKQERLRCTIYHEFGHHIHQQLGGQIGDPWVRPMEADLKKARRKSPSSGVNSPTRYCLTNEKEWFAENYSLAMMGRWDLVDPSPELRKILDGIIPT